MSEYREFTGKNVEDALEKAAAELSAKADELRYDILYHGSTGIFGLVGVKKAKIRVRLPQAPGEPTEGQPKGGRGGRGRKKSTPKPAPEASQAEPQAAPPEAAPEPPPETGEAPKKAAKPRRRSRGRGRKSSAAKENGEPAAELPESEPSENEVPTAAAGPRQPAGDFDDGMDFDDNGAPDEASEEERERVAQAAVEAVAVLAGTIMETPAVKADLSRPPQVTVIVEGPDSGIFIGRKGQTLEAVQYLVERMVLKKTGSRVRVQVDAGGYLARREEDLVRMAWKLAEKAKATRKPQSLAPMSAQERRVVHVALAGDKDIRTLSKGAGPRRKLVIVPQVPKGE